jgi:hypothetical protein
MELTHARKLAAEANVTMTNIQMAWNEARASVDPYSDVGKWLEINERYERAYKAALKRWARRLAALEWAEVSDKVEQHPCKQEAMLWYGRSLHADTHHDQDAQHSAWWRLNALAEQMGIRYVDLMAWCGREYQSVVSK